MTLENLHPRFPDSDHCQTCGDPYPCPTLTASREAAGAQLPDRGGDVIDDIRVALAQRHGLSDEHRAFYSEVVDRFEGLASERDRLRTAWESARRGRAEAREDAGMERFFARAAEADVIHLRKELRAESTRVSAARDERDQALRAARSIRDRIAGWLEGVGSAWEGAHVRDMKTLLPDTDDTLPEADMVEPGDEVTTLAELHDLVERLALDLSETGKAVTQRLAVVEGRLGITDDTPEGPARYRDADGDLWEETSPGYLLLAVRRLPHVRMARPYAVVDGEFGPLTPVTNETSGGAE